MRKHVLTDWEKENLLEIMESNLHCSKDIEGDIEITIKFNPYEKESEITMSHNGNGKIDSYLIAATARMIGHARNKAAKIKEMRPRMVEAFESKDYDTMATLKTEYNNL